MAKVNFIKARKEYRCAKCGRTIKVGEQYYKGTPFHRNPIIRCSTCGLKAWELSSSEYILATNDLKDNWQINYEVSDGVWDDIYSEVENIKSDCEDRLDNIPEQLQDGDAGITLQERIESLDEALNELNSICMSDFITEAYDNLYESDTEEIKKLVKEMSDDDDEDSDIDIELSYDELVEEYSDNESVSTLIENVNDLIAGRIDEILADIID